MPTADNELEDLRLAKEGVEALLCDAQAEVEELKWKLELAYAALRPFAEAYRYWASRRRPGNTCLPIPFDELARAAELVPEKKT